MGKKQVMSFVDMPYQKGKPGVHLHGHNAKKSQQPTERQNRLSS